MYEGVLGRGVGMGGRLLFFGIGFLCSSLWLGKSEGKGVRLWECVYDYHSFGFSNAAQQT